MGRLRRHSTRQRTFSRRVQRLVSYTWIVASLSLPIIGGALLAQSAINQRALLATQTTYVVQRGDTLNAIAARYGVPLDDLVQVNGLSNPNVIYVGQTLVIPREDTTTGGQIYTIQAGESLAAIARRYGVTVDDILTANNLPDRNAITAGQKITIPTDKQPSEAAQQEIIYTMQRGDSLYRVSLVFGVTVDDLLAANNLPSPNGVYPGLALRIPVSSTAPSETPPVEEPTSTAGQQTGGRPYTVRIGDTLTNIAINSGVTVDGLMAANGLTDPDRIYIGQVLNVPEAGGTARSYPAQTAVNVTVQEGDSLSAIAMRYGVTVQALAVANGILDASQIAVGQIISIPSAQAGSNSVRYASMGTGLCEGVTSTQVGTGYFIRPTTGYVITQRFLPWHSGIDLAADVGTLIFSADSGTVIFAGWNPAGYGYLTVLDHGNGWRTYYAHQSEIDVKCGDWVPRGSIIGKLGSTGNSTGPHLHFEMLRFGISVNPEGYVAF